MTPYRERVAACARGGTFKYFFPADAVAVVWKRLEDAFGRIRRNDTMKTMEIVTDRFIFRATFLANPITVFRKRRCEPADVDRFHALVGFVAGPLSDPDAAR